MCVQILNVKISPQRIQYVKAGILTNDEVVIYLVENAKFIADIGHAVLALAYSNSKLLNYYRASYVVCLSVKQPITASGLSLAAIQFI